MRTPPTLLDDAGNPSIATALLMSHHAFRRDLARFAVALAKIAGGDNTRAEAVHQEWQSYRGSLHGHHEIEDASMFPSFREQNPQLKAVIDRLQADHRHIDPLLERGDEAFRNLSKPAPAAAVVAELTRLLDEHLGAEEEVVVPLLRKATNFPAPGTDAELDMYAEGFAWSSHGVAPEVLERLDTMLPPQLVQRLPAARAAFQARCVRVWGSSKAGASRTSVPDAEPA